MNTVKLRATAYHEAGHAVLACRLGLGLNQMGVTIISGSDYAGSCSTQWGVIGNPEFEFSEEMRESAEKQAIVMLAGMEAQLKSDPSSVRSYHGESDDNNAADLIDYFTGGPDDLKPYLERLRAKTGELVEHYWQEICAVAEELLQRQTLNGPEVAKIVHQTRV